MKIIAVPREDNNPYQTLLYGEMRSYGVRAKSNVSSLLTNADAILLSYRKIATGGSVALSHGRPLIVLDLLSLAGLPYDDVIRNDGTAESLTSSLTELIQADASVFAKMSAAAYACCAAIRWSAIANMAFKVMDRILHSERSAA